jgi:DNA-binding NarL/FixJ family response regulator
MSDSSLSVPERRSVTEGGLVISIVIAERYELARKGLRAILEHEAGFEVIGEATGMASAAAMLDRVQPDILLLGLALDDMDGLRFLQHATVQVPRTRIVALVNERDHALTTSATELLEIGAGGYVLRSDPAGDLIAAVRTVASGGRHVSQRIARQAASEAAAVRTTEPESVPRRLSRREREILELLAEGHGNTEIGRRLFISPRTVETHRANILRKLNLRTRSDLVQYALRLGLLRHADR